MNKIYIGGFAFLILLSDFSWFVPELQAAGSPVISNIQVNNVTLTSAQITWVTDAPATTQVLFLDGNNQPTRRYPEPANNSFVTSHTVTLDNLIPNTNYKFFVASLGSSGDAGVSYNLISETGTISEFTTSAVDAGAPLDFRSDLIGSKNVYAGSNLYLTWRNVLLAGPNDHLTFESVSGLPSSIKFHVICAYNTDPTNRSADSYVNSQGQEWCWGGNNSKFSARFETTAGTAPGPYTANITVSSEGVKKTFSYTFNVMPAPAAVVKRSVSSIPPIPNLSGWENSMTALGQKWCNGQTYGFGYWGDVWYYDGGRVYLQVGDYTKNMSAWLPCAENVLNQYENFVNSNNGQIQGFAKFPFGMAMHYLRYGDAASKNGVTNLYNSVNDPYINGAAPVRGELVNPAVIRELSYGIDSMVAGEYAGLPRSPWLAQAVDGALAQIDELYKSDPWQVDQPFMGGLLAESLIAYYDVTKDPRIPPAIKQMLDWYWDNGVDKTNGQLTYNPIYVPSHYVSELNNMLAPAFAWYWNITGDPLYQQRGDLLFSHALDTDIAYDGKIFSENYKWSFDYVRYRSGNSLSTITPAANPLASSQQPVDGTDSGTTTGGAGTGSTGSTSTSTNPTGTGSNSGGNGGGNSKSTGGPSKSGNTPSENASPRAFLNKNLSLGARGTEVVTLQSFMLSQHLMTADNVTGYFGVLTQGAVKKFQSAQGIVSYGTPQTTGYGNVGPATRGRINSMLAASANAAYGVSTAATADTASLRAQISALQQQINALMLKIQGQR